MERVRKLDSYDVQNVLVPGLLKGMGYHVSWFAPPWCRRWTYIIAHPDALGIKKPTNKVSVRCRETKADVSDLRQFISRLHGDDVGIYFSVSGFTRGAEKETRSDTRQLRLIDFERFFGLWWEFDLGLTGQKAAIEAYSKQKDSVIQDHTYRIPIPIKCESTSTHVRASARP